MSALHPDTVRWIYEAIAALVIALVVAGLLFRLFFEGWRDYFRCTTRFLPFEERTDERVYDKVRGFVYNAIWGVSGLAAFYLLHKGFG